MRENKEEIFLWNGLRSGNEKNLHSLYLLFYNDLLRYGLSLTNDLELSKESVNGLFLSLWNNRQKLPEVKRPKAYIITSYKHRIIFRKKDSWSLKIVHPEYSENYLENQETASSEETMIELEEYELLKQKIKNVLNALTDRQRELIIGRFIHEMTYEEIALKYNISLRTVYNSIHESLKILRNQISKKHFS